MNEGHFIGLHDKTTCGGEVLDGHTGVMMFGIAHAREGDRVTCGKDGKTYKIVGGISYMISHGKAVAGTLDSYSDCPCRARLIPSVFGATYQSANSAPRAGRSAAQSVSGSATSQPAVPRHSAFASSNAPASAIFARPEPQEPGFYVVPRSMTRKALEATLFSTPDAVVLRKFRVLNPGKDDLKAGSLIVLGDPNNASCTYQEALLMQAAQEVKTALDPLTPDEADFMHRHAAEIASFTGQTSTWLGVSAAMMEKHIASLRDILQKIERLHQDNYRQHGHLRSPSFFADRRHLLSQLDSHLLNSTRLRGLTTIGDHPKLKSALGISSRSLVHHWDKAGGVGQIPGYSTHVSAVSRAAKYMQTGGFIGIAIGGVSSMLAVQAVCNGDSAIACEKIKFTEGSKFVGSTGMGYLGGELAYIASPIICAALGITTGIGGAVCVATVVGVGTFGGAEVGGLGGEFIGEKIFEATQP
ncbi:PAAR domain-containing protein [Pseudomonas putida]|uniref:PAAR domain-containing protein n=1 Tax=Pseudomonas putida TaxID=303 RepID=A0A2Z4RCK7_PSEPU|nr:PAAR domain-containing protein [Pseudomonas putida]AWY38505.1 PAAR domain-containing protein [Pseudomonas putida]